MESKDRSEARGKILDAWMMVERLSEGDMPKDKNIKSFQRQLQGDDYYTLLSYEACSHAMNATKLTAHATTNYTLLSDETCSHEREQSTPVEFRWQGGVVVYLGVFEFDIVVELIRKHYGLDKTHEDIKTGEKFTLALCFNCSLCFYADKMFDCSLRFDGDKIFYTESAYIRSILNNGTFPPGDGLNKLDEMFKQYEVRLKEQFAEYFADADVGKREHFNEAFRKVLCEIQSTSENCYLKVVGNLEADNVDNLHSFFIDDLGEAKKVDTDILGLYLFGGDPEDRVDLDTNIESPAFNSAAIQKILQPRNYPLGRFPSKTGYSLSLMQQVAVNLATGYDARQMRSVNGPPGTGKTTLLKDVFAELVVEQAYEIAQLQDKRIPCQQEYHYEKRGGSDMTNLIGAMPPEIADKGIVVASTNNGAVQNIVNELPLVSRIDEALLKELMDADYFVEIANKSGGGKSPEGDQAGVCDRERWGLFSMEGGKSTNMKGLLEAVDSICKALYDNTFCSASEAYGEFIKQAQAVEGMRDQAQCYAGACERVATLQIAYNSAVSSQDAWDKGHEAALQERLDGLEAEKVSCANGLDDARAEQRRLEEERDAAEAQLRIVRQGRPSLFARHKAKKEYRERLTAKINAADQICNSIETCIGDIDTRQARLASLERDMKSVRDEFEREGARLAREANEAQRRLEEARHETSSLVLHLQQVGVSPLDISVGYEKLQLSNPWFGEEYRKAQSRLFIAALKVRKQFLYDNRKSLCAALRIWKDQNRNIDHPEVIKAAFEWINMAVPVISSTFASFSRMCRNLGPGSLGHLFVDEAGQALPQAAVGAVFRSRHVTMVGDPSQIPPVLTLDSSVLSLLDSQFEVDTRYLSASASAQTLADAASRYGFYREIPGPGTSGESWVGVPLWVHRRCKDPMFSVSNAVSYGGLMVQGVPDAFGRAEWFNITGKAEDKWVKEQGEFLKELISWMMEADDRIGNKSPQDIVYVITPFRNVARQLAKQLDEINFTRHKDNKPEGKPLNVGTIHTFQGKEAPIVFLVLGADKSSEGAARWAVDEPNMMNVAASRAKEEFYIVGDRDLYCGLKSKVVEETCSVIRSYLERHPDIASMRVGSIACPTSPGQIPPGHEARYDEIMRKYLVSS